MGRKINLLVSILFFIILVGIFAYGQRPRIMSITNLFCEDIGERESLFFRLFKAGGGLFEDPAWSPDGKMVAFCFGYERPARPEESRPNGYLCILNLETKEIKKIGTTIGAPSWFPDSQWLAVGGELNGLEGIFKIKIDGSEYIYLGDGHWPRVSPDGTKIAYETYEPPGIWVMNSDGSNPRQLSNYKFEYYLSWSPDSKKIAFQSPRGGDLNIWVMNSDGTNPVQITQKGGAFPAWSPNGQWIAFERNHQLWLVSPDGKEEIQLKIDFPILKMAWAPDSSRILVQGTRNSLNDKDLYIVSIKF